MNLWIDDEERPSRERLSEMWDAGRAILEAGDNLDADDLLMFDLQTNVATRYVAMALHHVHDQDCRRA